MAKLNTKIESAGHYYQLPIGFGRYFGGGAANDNRPLLANNHGLYVALAALVAVCLMLVSLL